MIAHTHGAQEYARLIGPAALNSPAGRALIRDIRSNSVSTVKHILSPTTFAEHYPLQLLASVGARTQSFFSEQKWAQILRQDTSRTAKDDLMDLIAQLVAIMEQRDQLKAIAAPRSAQAGLQYVQARCRALIDHLTRWHTTTLAGAYFYEPSSMLEPGENEELSKLSPRRRTYTSVVLAELEVLYSTIQAMTHLELINISKDLQQRFEAAENESPDQTQERDTEISSEAVDIPAIMQTVRRHIDAVVQSMEYCLHPSSGVLTANMLIFPLMVSMGLMQSWRDPRVEYVMALVRQYQLQSGVRLADLLTEGMRWPAQGKG